VIGLDGRPYDAISDVFLALAGHRMAPTHATKAGIRYRYYVSLPCLHGAAKTAKVGSGEMSGRKSRRNAQFGAVPETRGL
jgi:hypothetical protein